MPEYIERGAVLAEMISRPLPNDASLLYFAMRGIVRKAPTADVVEVKHGEWIEYQTPNIICCSECDWGTGVDEKTFKYCPNCGAKMDLKEGADNE